MWFIKSLQWYNIMRSIKLKSKSTQFIYNSNHIINPLKSQLFFHLFCLSPYLIIFPPLIFFCPKVSPFAHIIYFPIFSSCPIPFIYLYFFLASIFATQDWGFLEGSRVSIFSFFGLTFYGSWWFCLMVTWKYVFLGPVLFGASNVRE